MIGFNGGLIGVNKNYATIASNAGVITLGEQIYSRHQYRYIRWTITAVRTPGSGTQASEFNLRNGSTNITMSLAIVITDPVGAFGGGTETANSLKDANINSKWYTNQNPTISVIFDMGASVIFNGYRWATANDDNRRDPVSWTVAGSNNGTEYYTFDTKTNFATTTSRNTYVGPFTVSI